ncbi:hypothetical protein ACFL0V_06765 [Nanoarchaeota archaeon]
MKLKEILRDSVTEQERLYSELELETTGTEAGRAPYSDFNEQKPAHIQGVGFDRMLFRSPDFYVMDDMGVPSVFFFYRDDLPFTAEDVHFVMDPTKEPRGLLGAMKQIMLQRGDQRVYGFNIGNAETLREVQGYMDEMGLDPQLTPVEDTIPELKVDMLSNSPFGIVVRKYVEAKNQIIAAANQVNRYAAARGLGFSLDYTVQGTHQTGVAVPLSWRVSTYHAKITLDETVEDSAADRISFSVGLTGRDSHEKRISDRAYHMIEKILQRRGYLTVLKVVDLGDQIARLMHERPEQHPTIESAYREAEQWDRRDFAMMRDNEYNREQLRGVDEEAVRMLDTFRGMEWNGLVELSILSNLRYKGSLSGLVELPMMELADQITQNTK